MKKKLWISIFLAVIIIFGCKKDTFYFPSVSFRLDLGLDNQLATIGSGGVLFVPGYGVKGLVVYRDYNDSYFVFDRACTYEKDFSCQVDTTSIQGVLKCPCCNSRFLLGETADPINGPASYPLVRYSAFIDGRLLKIAN